MKNAESVTFGGSDLNRAHHLRAHPEAIAELADRPSARCLLFWRGKPLVSGAERDTLVRLPLDHPALVGASADRLFLGLEEEDAVFAADISAWNPEDLDYSTLGTFLDPTEQRHPDLPEDCVFAELRAVMTQLSPRDAELAATAKALFGWHESHRFCARCGAPSTLVSAGWQRNCPSCGGQHFPRTDPVVIMLITNGNSVLLGRSPGWPEGMYSLLAGFIEPGETIEAAVRREVWEEAGIKVGAVGYLASQPWAFPASLMIGCHGTATSTEISVDPEELETALWVTREEVAAAFRGEHPVIRPSRRGAIARFLLENWLADSLN